MFFNSILTNIKYLIIKYIIFYFLISVELEVPQKPIDLKLMGFLFKTTFNIKSAVIYIFFTKIDRFLKMQF